MSDMEQQQQQVTAEIEVEGMEIPDTYHQISEEGYKESKLQKYFHCYVCHCKITGGDKETLGCMIHPECSCNMDMFFHGLI